MQRLREIIKINLHTIIAPSYGVISMYIAQKNKAWNKIIWTQVVTYYTFILVDKIIMMYHTSYTLEIGIFHIKIQRTLEIHHVNILLALEFYVRVK